MRRSPQYRVQLGFSQAGPFFQHGLTSGNSYTVKGLPNGTAYYYPNRRREHRRNGHARHGRGPLEQTLYLAPSAYSYRITVEAYNGVYLSEPHNVSVFISY